MTPTARGFGNSCGVPPSRTPDCAQGWVRLDDMRYEVRDVQTLVGRLVDERRRRPERDRRRPASPTAAARRRCSPSCATASAPPSGGYAPWTSPDGHADLAARRVAALAVDQRREHLHAQRPRRRGRARRPASRSQAYAGAIFARRLRRLRRAARRRALRRHHAVEAAARRGRRRRRRPRRRSTTPTATTASPACPGARRRCCVQSGWTDALFPVPQALGGLRRAAARATRARRSRCRSATSATPPAANHPDDIARLRPRRPGVLRRVAEGHGRQAGARRRSPPTR